MSVCDSCYEEGCFGYNNLSCPCSKTCHEADEKKAKDDADKIRQLELQNQELQNQLQELEDKGKTWICPEDYQAALRLNDEYRRFVEQMVNNLNPDTAYHWLERARFSLKAMEKRKDVVKPPHAVRCQCPECKKMDV